MNTFDAFRKAAEKDGLALPENLVPGRFVRFPGIGKSNGNKSGWAKISEDGQCGAYGDWASGMSGTWHAQYDHAMTAAERAADIRRVAELQRIREDEERLGHAEAAQQAQRLWDGAQPAPTDHPYLMRKGIHPHGVRVTADSRLLIPVTIDGTITSVQFIDANGGKQFLPGGKVRGGSFTIGGLSDPDTLLLVEGFATGASLSEATNLSVVVAFSAGNLIPVAEHLRQQCPTATIVVCGDSDLSGAGQWAAREAAEAINGVVVLPEEQGQDFNDVHVQRGLDAVKMAIETALLANNSARCQPPLPAEQVKKIAESVERYPTRDARGGSRADRGFVKELADEILRTAHFARDAGGQLYIFDRGVYRPHGKAAILKNVKAILEVTGNTNQWTSHRALEVAEFIRVDAALLCEHPPSNVMNLTNGLLDVTTGTLAPHSPGHLSPIQLPVAFDPSARCPLWESFAGRVLPSDCQTLPFEVTASAMCGDITDQKAVLFVGPGENGKSTLLEAIIAFLGRENVSTLALQRLEADKFSVVRLLGKLANVCADLPSDHLAGTSIFKALTGGDRLTGERKFQESFEFSPFARLLFSTNHYPTSKDASHAFFRRWLVIPFDAVLDPREKILNLAARLATPGELSGVLNQALAVLPGMIQRGGFTQSESTQASLMEFREMTDPLAAWLDRFTVLSSDGVVSKKDLAISYNAAAEAAGRPLMTSKAFHAAVRRLRPALHEGQRRVSGEVKDVFLGVALAAHIPATTGQVSALSADSAHFSQVSLGETEERVTDLTGRNGLNELTPLTGDGEPCFACRSTRRWKSVHGTVVCAECHPPCSEALVAEWL